MQTQWEQPRTTWRLLALPGRIGLNVELAVDTTAPPVVTAVEDACQSAGIVLVREAEDDEAA